MQRKRLLCICVESRQKPPAMSVGDPDNLNSSQQEALGKVSIDIAQWPRS